MEIKIIAFMLAGTLIATLAAPLMFSLITFSHSYSVIWSDCFPSANGRLLVVGAALYWLHPQHDDLYQTCVAHRAPTRAMCTKCCSNETEPLFV
jgi:hypothetical protein